MSGQMMDSTVDARWQRWGYLGGVVFVVLMVISAFAPGSPPATDASAEKIANYFMDNDAGMKVGAILFGFGLIFALWWLGSMWRVISKLEPGGPRLAIVFAAGMIMSGGIASIAQAMFSAVAIRIDSLGASSEFVFTFCNALFGIALAAIAVHLLAAGALTLRSKFLPAWTGWLALVGALACLIGVIGSGNDSAGIGVLMFVGFLLWMLWILIVSVLLYMRKAA